MRTDNAWIILNIIVIEEFEVRVCGKLNSSGVTMSGGVTRAGEWLYVKSRKLENTFPDVNWDEYKQTKRGKYKRKRDHLGHPPSQGHVEGWLYQRLYQLKMCQLGL